MSQTSINGVDVAVLEDAVAAIEKSPELGAVRFRASSEWVHDRRVQSSIRSYRASGAEHDRPEPHRIPTDLPTGIMGTDQGPSPLELALAALTSCVATTIVAQASVQGIALQSVNVGVEGDFDLRGVLNLSDEVRKGYEQLTLAVAVRADLSDEACAAFAADAMEASPMLDLFRHGTRIRAELR